MTNLKKAEQEFKRAAREVCRATAEALPDNHAKLKSRAHRRRQHPDKRYDRDPSKNILHLAFCRDDGLGR